MSPVQIAQWFATNPGQWQNFVDNLAVMVSDVDLLMLADQLQDFVYNNPEEPDDEDDGAALASAGWGTDEDYGGGVDYL
jgi:hypothetical protein